MGGCQWTADAARPQTMASGALFFLLLIGLNGHECGIHAPYRRQASAGLAMRMACSRSISASLM